MPIKLTLPLSDADIRQLKIGDRVELSGTLYVGRDAAHQRLIQLLENGQSLPFPLANQAIYYAGPAPAKPGQPIGSIGPTTSGRMDAYAPQLIQEGLKVMIGKGLRSPAVQQAIVENGGLYLAAIGGAAALISESVLSSQVIAFEELGPEAIRKLEVQDFPAIVAIDARGADIYQKKPKA